MRSPTPEEHSILTRIFHHHFSSTGRTASRISTVLCVVGIFLTGSYNSNGLFAVFLGLLCFVFSFVLLYEKKKTKMIADRIEVGNFLVTEGSVYEYHNDWRTAHSYSVRFLSNHGQHLNKWYAARCEEVTNGTPLLLVYVSNSPIKRINAWVFTPFMLTNEGIKMHW